MSEIIALDTETSVRKKKSRFVVFYKESILSIQVNHVSYFTLQKGNVRLFTLHGKDYQVKKNLSEIEESLDTQLFFRVSRSTIVSYEGIDRMETYFGQRAVLFMKPSGKIIVTKGRLTAFFEWLDQ